MAYSLDFDPGDFEISEESIWTSGETLEAPILPKIADAIVPNTNGGTFDNFEERMAELSKVVEENNTFSDVDMADQSGTLFTTSTPQDLSYQKVMLMMLEVAWDINLAWRKTKEELKEANERERQLLDIVAQKETEIEELQKVGRFMNTR